MKYKMTFSSLVLTCLILSACSHSHDPTEQTPTYSYISLGEFPASRDVAENIPVARYDEISMTRKVIKDGQAVSEEPRRVGLQAVATPVFNADGTSKMVVCSGQQKLATVLELSQNNRSDSFGVNPPLYWWGLSWL